MKASNRFLLGFRKASKLPKWTHGLHKNVYMNRSLANYSNKGLVRLLARRGIK